MTSVLSDLNVALSPDQGTADLRLELVPSPGIRGLLDGYWWPRTHELLRELPALVATAQDRFGVVVTRASMSTTFWDTTPEKITVGDRVVQVAWFRAHDAHTIRLLGGDAWHSDLLVIPPDTPSDVAREALSMVTRADSVGWLNDLLTAHEPG